MSFDSLIKQIESQRNSSGQILEISNTSTQEIIDYNNEGNTKKVDTVLFQNFISRDTNKIPNNTIAVNASIVQSTKALELIEYSLIQSQKINALSFIPQRELEKYQNGILFAAESGQVVAFN